MERVLAVATGVAWTVGVTLVATQADTDPVGAGYDAANRGLTATLLLLPVLLLRVRRRHTGAMRRATTVLVVGTVLLLAGNVLEFWGVLLGDLETQKTAVRLGLEKAYWGSVAGWAVFAAGLLTTIGGLVLQVRAAGPRRALLPMFAAVVGLAATGLWAVSPVPAAVASLGLGLWAVWLVDAGGPAVSPAATGSPRGSTASAAPTPRGDSRSSDR